MACSRFRFIFPVLAFFTAFSARAFTLELVSGNTAAGWSSNNVAVNLDPSCANDSVVTNALNAAVALWNSVPSSDLKLSVGTTQSLSGSITTYTTGTPSFVGGPLLYCDTAFDSDFSVPSGEIPGLDVAPTLNCASGQTFCPIQGSLVVLNTDSSDPDDVDSLNSTEPVIVQVVLAHELGHALGLGHSSDVNALMYYNASQKTQLSLAQDDANGISYLYPRNELGSDGVFGCGSLAVVGAGNSGSSRGKGGGGALGMLAEFSLLLAACYAFAQGARKLGSRRA